MSQKGFAPILLLATLIIIGGVGIGVGASYIKNNTSYFTRASNKATESNLNTGEYISKYFGYKFNYDPELKIDYDKKKEITGRESIVSELLLTSPDIEYNNSVIIKGFSIRIEILFEGLRDLEFPWNRSPYAPMAPKIDNSILPAGLKLPETASASAYTRPNADGGILATDIFTSNLPSPNNQRRAAIRFTCQGDLTRCKASLVEILESFAFVESKNNYVNPFTREATNAAEIAQKKKVDENRSKVIKLLYSKIQNFFDTRGTLPTGLAELELDYAKDNTDGRDLYTNKFFEYKKVGDKNFQICANFLYEYSENKIPNDLDPNNGKYSHPKGDYCFDLIVVQKESVTDIDPNIEKVELDLDHAKLLATNFPAGFFNSKNEWGIITYATNFIIVNITFRQPVKIKSITNLFTDCPKANCYNWYAKGKSFTREASVDLVNSTYTNADIESKVEIATDDSGRLIQSPRSTDTFKQISITAYREEDRSAAETTKLYWKKIKLEYN